MSNADERWGRRLADLFGSELGWKPDDAGVWDDAPPDFRVAIDRIGSTIAREAAAEAEARLDEAGKVLGEVCVIATLRPDEGLARAPQHAASQAALEVVQQRNQLHAERDKLRGVLRDTTFALKLMITRGDIDDIDAARGQWSIALAALEEGPSDG